MTKSPEQLDEFIRLVQNHGDASTWKKGPADAGLVNVISLLKTVPKADAPRADLLRVRNRILDKISLPATQPEYAGYAALFRALPRIARLAGGLVGAFTIMLSLTVGTAVAALESVPGQTIYPIKRMVESVQLKLESDPQQKTNLQIKFANNRVDELEAILQKQKEGKASDEEVQMAAAEAVKGVQETAAAVTDQSKDEPQVDMLAKIVTLTDKQAAVITAAQATDGEADPNPDLELALQASKDAKEQAISNIEKAGLVVEAQPMVITADPAKDADLVTAEGQLTYVGRYSVNIGSAQFLLTDTTEYANITLEALEEGSIVKIIGEIRNDNTYATKIELQSPPEPEPAEPAAEPVQAVPQASGGSEPQTVPAVPQ